MRKVQILPHLHAMLFAAGLASTIALAFSWMRRCCRAATRALAQERRLREELEAYAALPLQTVLREAQQTEAQQALARSVCAAVAEHSSFAAAALLLRAAGTELRVAGSAGIDDLLQRALNDWGERFTREQQQSGPMTRGERAPVKRRRSYTVTLGPLDPLQMVPLPQHDPLRQDPTRPVATKARPNMCPVTIFPLLADRGTLLGALAVAMPRRTPQDSSTDTPAILSPLEALAAQLGRALENASLNEQLRRAEKMAGLAHLARGVAHELNNPLTVVVGYAELIAASAQSSGADIPTAAGSGARSQSRRAADANAILLQAARMKQTIASLLDFWRPPNQADDAIDLRRLLQETIAGAEPQLAAQAITVDLQLGKEDISVCGSADRLAAMLMHLLENAAEAIARFHLLRQSASSGYDAGSRPAELVPAIRITLACEADTVQLVVSDTGAGFDDPGRIFDPFYTTRPPATSDGKAQGLGLALAYGIVREHSGNISALNLHPHGAAVIVELPLARTFVKSGERALAPANLMQ